MKTLKSLLCRFSSVVGENTFQYVKSREQVANYTRLLFGSAQAVYSRFKPQTSAHCSWSQHSESRESEPKHSLDNELKLVIKLSKAERSS